MEQQVMFDVVVAHARAQGRQATRTAVRAINGHLGSTKACVYRAPNGDKCFIGALIRDDEYRPEMEFRNVSSLIQSHMSLLVRFGGNSAFLTQLQEIHDRLEPDRWPRALRAFAQRWGLIYRGDLDLAEAQAQPVAETV